MAMNVIARINRKNSTFTGFVTEGFQTVMNLGLATKFTFSDIGKQVTKLNSCDKEYIYQVWTIEIY